MAMAAARREDPYGWDAELSIRVCCRGVASRGIVNGPCGARLIRY